MVNEVIKKIEAQQKGLDEFSPAYQVGEQLKDICRSCPDQAELLLNDLDNKEMAIWKAEKKIKEFADQHKKSNCSCCPPHIADRILREFYGFALASNQNDENGILSLAEFF